MDVVDQIRAFVATAQTGSFTAAADQLGMSNRLTSKYVAELEARLGVRLFQRTTRRVGLTPAGEDLLARAPAILDDLDDLLGSVAAEERGLSGVLRVSAPITFGEVYVTAMLGRFANAHPGVTVDLRLSDAFADLARDGIDLAIRLGQSDTLSLRARKLGTFGLIAVASPAYIAAHGAPVTPKALRDHACIVDTNRRVARRWSFRRGQQEHVVMVDGRFRVNSASAALELAGAGLGIAYTPRFALQNRIDSGALVPVLTEYEGESGPVSAVYLDGRTVPRKIRALIDFALQDIRSTRVLDPR